MATITTDTFLDDGTARTAGEAWTCNGARLTVRTDTRWHAGSPASMNGSLGSVTLSASLGGGYTIDGRNVRWMPYSSGTGNVPAIGTSITQGGVSGYLLGVWASTTSAPTAVGAAMPATGFIKFRGVTGGAFSAGALTGIGASADSADVVGWIEVVHDQSTTMVASRLCDITIRGSWFDLGTTSGAANQLVQVPTNGSSTAYVPGVWISTTATPTTDADWEFYPAIYAGLMITANLGTDARSKFVCMETDGRIRIGHNGTTTVGFVPATGMKIRIPNIFGRQCTSGARATNAIPAAAVTPRPKIALDGGGQFDCENIACDWFLQGTNGYLFKLNYSATFDAIELTNIESQIDIYNGGNGLSASISAIALRFTACRNGGAIEEWTAIRSTTASCIDCLTSANLQFSFIKAGTLLYARGTTSFPFTFNTSNTITIANSETYQGYINIVTSSDITITALDYNDRFVGGTITTDPVWAVVTQTGSSDILVDGVTFGLNGSIADCHPYNGVFYAGVATNVTYRNLGTRSAFVSGGTVNNPAYIFQSAGSCQNVRVQRCYMAPTRTSAAVVFVTDKKVEFTNVYGDFADVQPLPVKNALVRNCGFTNTTTGQVSAFGTHFFDAFTSNTAGRLVLAFNEASADTAAFVNKTGNPKYTGGGAVVLAVLSDEVIYEQSYFVLGVTALANAAPTVTGTNVTFASGKTWGNHSLEYKIDYGAGFSAWKDLNQTNLATETGINPATGFKLKIRAICTTANANNLLTYIRIDTVSSLTDQTNNLYPLDVVPATFSFSGLAAGTEVVLFNSANVELQRSTGATFTYNYNWTADTTGNYALIWKGNKAPIKVTGITLTATSFNIPIQQSNDYVYTTVGTPVSTFNTGSKLQILDTGTTTASVPRMYSDWKDWLRLSSNAQYDFAYSPLGGDNITGAIYIPFYAFLVNGWKVRPQEANHTLEVTDGILVASGDPFAATVGTYTIKINYQQPVQAFTAATGSAVLPSDVTDIAAAVDASTILAKEVTAEAARKAAKLAAALSA